MINHNRSRNLATGMGCGASSNETVIVDRAVKPVPLVRNDEPPIVREPPQQAKNETRPQNQILNGWLEKVKILEGNQHLTEWILSKPRRDMLNFQQLIDAFKQNPITEDETQKAWLVYVWVTRNMVLDPSMTDRNLNQIIQDGRATCKQYAELFAQLATALGFECERVNGYSKAFGYEPGDKLVHPNHHWNRIKINGTVENVDPAWGSGHINTDNGQFETHFNPFYFLTPSVIFAHKHYSPLYDPQTLDEFENYPIHEIEFYLCGLGRCVSHSTCRVETNSSVFTIEFESDRDVFMLGELTINDEEILQNCLLVQAHFDPDSQVGRQTLIVHIPEHISQCKLNVYGKERQKAGDECDLLTRFLIVCQHTESFDYERIPKCQVRLENDVRLLSHQTRLINFEHNPVVLTFSLPDSCRLMFKLVEIGDKLAVENGIFNHFEPESTTNLSVNISLPQTNTTYVLKFFARNESKGEKKHKWIGDLHLMRTGSNENDNLKYVDRADGLLNNRQFVIEKPVQLKLNANEVYEFRYCIEEAIKVALVDATNQISFLENVDAKNCSWWQIRKSFTECGRLSLVARFKGEHEFLWICSYEINEL